MASRTMGTVSGETPEGQPEPEGAQPLLTFDCMARKDGRMGAASIWLML